jgi:hypothetical protein
MKIHYYLCDDENGIPCGTEFFKKEDVQKELLPILKQAFFLSCGKRYDEIKDLPWWNDTFADYKYKFEKEVEKLILELS